ncbi:MAG: HlyD family efflux transporter periplasmic adaptor subunit, partial [Alkalinema sp. RU_4_3]|nr:HlyD family efflux transporter periplasmic adaptor subunit [Alkalinema sp. RU_4_3]
PSPQAPAPLPTVTALGKLEPLGAMIRVSAANTGDGSRIEELRVKEGDRVQKGDIIAVLNSQKRLQASLNQASEQVRVVQAKLAQVKSGAKSGEIQAQNAEIARIKAERTGDLNTQTAVVARLKAERTGEIAAQTAAVARLEAEVENARVEADRYDTLYKDGGVSASLRDSKRLVWQTSQRQLQEGRASLERIVRARAEQINEAQAALDRSQSSRDEQLEAASATLDRIAEVRPVDVQTAQAEVNQAQAAVEKAEAELEQAYVRAPEAGSILKINTRAGEKIAAEGIVDMGRTQEMTALVEVYESDVKRIQVGDSAVVMSDAIGSELKGTVSEIGQKVLRQNVVNTDPTANTDSRVMEVRIRLDRDASKEAEKFTNSQVTAKITLSK